MENRNKKETYPISITTNNRSFPLQKHISQKNYLLKIVWYKNK